MYVILTTFLSLQFYYPATDVDVTEFGFVINIIMVVVVSLHLAIETLHWVSEREKHHIVTVHAHTAEHSWMLCSLWYFPFFAYACFLVLASFPGSPNSVTGMECNAI